jgi:hypothetical protein
VSNTRQHHAVGHGLHLLQRSRVNGRLAMHPGGRRCICGEGTGGEQINHRGRAITNAAVGRGRLDCLLLQGLQGVTAGKAVHHNRTGRAGWVGRATAWLCGSSVREISPPWVTGSRLPFGSIPERHCDRGGGEGSGGNLCCRIGLFLGMGNAGVIAALALALARSVGLSSISNGFSSFQWSVGPTSSRCDNTSML